MLGSRPSPYVVVPAPRLALPLLPLPLPLSMLPPLPLSMLPPLPLARCPSPASTPCPTLAVPPSSPGCTMPHSASSSTQRFIGWRWSPPPVRRARPLLVPHDRSDSCLPAGVEAAGQKSVGMTGVEARFTTAVAAVTVTGREGRAVVVSLYRTCQDSSV